MQLIAPVTDYIPASILTTHGDIVERGAVIPERLAGGAEDLHFKAQGVGASPIWEALSLADTGVVFGNGTQAVSGDDVITGIGFQPSLVIFMACGTAPISTVWSIGFDNGADAYCLEFRGNPWSTINLVNSISCMDGAGNDMVGAISALGADGFTITFVEAGNRDINYSYICLP